MLKHLAVCRCRVAANIRPDRAAAYRQTFQRHLTPRIDLLCHDKPPGGLTNSGIHAGDANAGRPLASGINAGASQVHVRRETRIDSLRHSCRRISAGALPLHPAKGARPSGLPLFFKNKKGKRAKEQREKSSPRTNNHTRPDVVVPIIRVEPAAVGRAAVVRIVAPRPAAQHLRLSIA